MPLIRTYLTTWPRCFTFSLLLLLTSPLLQAQRGPDFNILSHDRDSFGIIELRKSGFHYISPLLDCFSTTTVGLRTIKVIEDELLGYIASVKESGIADQISVYYRDLNNGPWLGIDEEENYAPASLLKLPLLIAALKYAQTDPGYLGTQIKYVAPQDQFKQNIITGNMIIPGQTYTFSEILEHMIIYSDNEAKNIITQSLPEKQVSDVYFDLGIDLYKNTDPDNFMTVKEYASFFRVLYNASYLNKDMSEYALQLLTQTQYQQGIVAGLPDGIVVSHKFGERYYPQKKMRQLHDCGIVYLSGHPYLVCVMTRGHDFQELQTVISDISWIIFNVLKKDS